MTVIAPELLDILACPQDRGPLLLVDGDGSAAFLYNPRLKRAYRIDDGIPVLLVDEARDVPEDEHSAIEARVVPPRVE